MDPEDLEIDQRTGKVVNTGYPAVSTRRYLSTDRRPIQGPIKTYPYGRPLHIRGPFLYILACFVATVLFACAVILTLTLLARL
jgi:hypothetical protein